MKKIFILIVIFLVGCSSPSSSDENKAKIKAVYDAWESGTKEEWMSAYLGILADDFYRWNGRYVGLGFRINTEEMTVIEATASPAKDYFMPGDKFVSVNGMVATPENADDLPFRGALGGEVVVVLERDGSEQTVSMKRAAQVNDATADEITTNLENWDGWDQRPEMSIRRPLIAEDNVVYAAFQLAFEDENGNEITWWNIERFVFNEDGQLSSHADLSEELFFQEQMGYYLTNE